MYDPLSLILTIAVVLLIVVIVFFFGLLIVVLFAIKKTLHQLQNAISNVEDTALRSLAPLLSFRAMFSDTQHFVSAAKKVVQLVQGKKNKTS